MCVGGGGGGGVRSGAGVRVDVNQEIKLLWCGVWGFGGCYMCKKVLYDIKNNEKNVGGGGGGAIFEPKTLSRYLKEFFNQDGIRTQDLRVCVVQFRLCCQV